MPHRISDRYAQIQFIVAINYQPIAQTQDDIGTDEVKSEQKSARGATNSAEVRSSAPRIGFCQLPLIGVRQRHVRR